MIDLVLLIIGGFFAYLLYVDVFKVRYKTRKYAFDYVYRAGLLLLTVACFSLPLNYWQFEKKMARVTDMLAGISGTKFHCNDAIDSIFDNKLNVRAHASPVTKQVVFQVGGCGDLIDYIDDPESADYAQWFAFHALVHEAMHISGEMNEQKTDCMALQRHVKAAQLLNLPQDLTQQRVAQYYQGRYLQHPYHSKECRAGGLYDEKMANAPWEQPSVTMK